MTKELRDNILLAAFLMKYYPASFSYEVRKKIFDAMKPLFIILGLET
jgi:hypothetical protein